MPAVLGLDIGGTKVALRLERRGGPALDVSFEWATAGSRDDIALLDEHVCALRDRGGEPIGAIGVAVPATLDARGRVVAWPGRPSWLGIGLGEALRRLGAGAPVVFGDDGDLAALAEAQALREADVVYLGVGTGVGGGAVLGGRGVPGSHRGSCEIGHVIVERGGPTCDCGRSGCVQAVASGPATLRRATGRRGAPVTPAALAAGVRAGESWAVTTLGETCAALAAAVVSLGEVLRPSVVVVGGGFAAGMPGFVERVREHAVALGRPGHPAPRVQAGTFGSMSSLHGAVLLARDGLTVPL